MARAPKKPAKPINTGKEDVSGATTNVSSDTTAANPNAPESAQPIKVATVSIHRQRIGFLGWKPDKPDVRDRRMALTRPSLPRSDFLDPDLLAPVRDQGNQGSCTGHASKSAVQFKRKQNGEPDLELSPRFAYYNGRMIEGLTDQDSGCEIRDVIKGVSKLGVCSETLCPYSDKGRSYMQRPTSAAYKEGLTDLVTQYERVPQSVIGIKSAITNQNPIVFGFTVYENFMDDVTAADGIMREPEGGTDGGHAVYICGYDDAFDFGWTTGGVLIGNSWGAEWGAQHPLKEERGYFWMPWVLLTNNDFCDDLWAIDMVAQ
jgi:C1A family cysteine protease